MFIQHCRNANHGPIRSCRNRGLIYTPVSFFSRVQRSSGMVDTNYLHSLLGPGDRNSSIDLVRRSSYRDHFIMAWPPFVYTYCTSNDAHQMCAASGLCSLRQDLVYILSLLCQSININPRAKLIQRRLSIEAAGSSLLRIPFKRGFSHLFPPPTYVFPLPGAGIFAIMLICPSHHASRHPTRLWEATCNMSILSHLHSCHVSTRTPSCMI